MDCQSRHKPSTAKRRDSDSLCGMNVSDSVMSETAIHSDPVSNRPGKEQTLSPCLISMASAWSRHPQVLPTIKEASVSR